MLSWDQGMGMPTGIMLASAQQLDFQPYVSPPRPAGAPPYERLVLISSRIFNPMKVASSVLPNVGIIAYDWKNFTIQELYRYVERVLGASKVTSIAVLAPGNTPGCIALLEGFTTTPERLQEGGDLLQFWRQLSGYVAASSTQDGRRIDLIGCRLMEAPHASAALLKELWKLTAVPFAAADHALRGYMLSTFMEEPHSGNLSLISSSVQGIDLYFDRAYAPILTILGCVPAVKLKSHSSGWQVHNFVHDSPGKGEDQSRVLHAGYESMLLGIQSPPGQGQVQPAAPLPDSLLFGKQPMPPKEDVFQCFLAAAAVKGLSLPTVFQMYDVDKSGQLTQAQVTSMLMYILPGVTVTDVQHFQAMMDMDGNGLISLQEFMLSLQGNQGIHEQIRGGSDDTLLLHRLHDYLTDNEAILREYFSMSDSDNNGLWDHSEVAAFVRSIPNLLLLEQKQIISYLYQSDKNGDDKLTFDELKAVIASFGGQRAKVTIARCVPHAGTVQPRAMETMHAAVDVQHQGALLQG